MKVLVVDDEKLSRRTLSFYMQKLGYQVFQAENGQEALQCWRNESPHIVLTDWNMPGMQGIDLLKAIRADEKLCHLPVLMVTAEAKREQIIEAAQAGVNGYIVKPFTAATLKEKLDKIFERIG